MRVHFPLKLAFAFLFTLLAAAQNSVTKLPTRAECEACATKKAKTLLEKYGSAEKFVGCLVAGGTSAQIVQIDNLLKTAQSKKDKFALKSSTPAVRFLILRNIRSYLNLVDYGADFALKFPFEKEYIKNSMTKLFNSQKAKAQEIRDWVNRMQVILDKEHPDVKKGMDNAIANVKMNCDITWNKAKNGLIYPESLFFDREKSNVFVVGCAEIGMNFYSLLRTPAPKNHNKVKPKRIPYCSDKKTLNGWDIFWKSDYFSLKPKLYNIKKGLSITSLSIGFSDASNNYWLNFNFSSGAPYKDDAQQIYVDGVKIHEGKWTITRYADGKLRSVKPPPINKKVIDFFNQGKEVEIKVLRKKMVDDTSSALGYKWQMILQTSARFSLKDFRQALAVAKAGKTLKATEKKQGRCKE
ncbi:hypothetical protein [Gelatiniphilus marinus]|uniref:Uncharacterized protein n=1 Tax=Gelatiniphilus marinus TaxID=1759464 RepID=A0ABW5JQQ6_9FLAO